MTSLANQVAIVTGAGQGVGEGIARRLAAAGATVVVAEFNPESGTRVAEALHGLGGKGHFIATDIRDRDSTVGMVEQTIGRFGRLDILVNNAYPTGSMPQRLEHRDYNGFAPALTAGFESVWWTMKAAHSTMKQQSYGRIVNICSLNGVNAHPFTADYNSAKEAVRALSRTAAREWARHGICINVICPAAVTPAYRKFQELDPENCALMLRQNPMGRMGEPEQDIGGVALFLASEDCRYLTGNTLFVDGGSHINGVSWAPDLPE